MGLRDLFINGGEEVNKKLEIKKEEPINMPSSFKSSTPTVMPTSIPTSLDQGPRQLDVTGLDRVLKAVEQTYTNGFNHLNREGYDFFEYYQAIKSINGTTPEHYKMAYTMGKSMNPSITPDSLVSDAQYYIGEIQKVYNQYESSGQQKAKEAEESKSKRRETLNFEIQSLKEQISNLQAELEAKTNEFNGNNSPYDSALQDINLKLEANKIAGHNLIFSLQEVSNNIKNFLQ